MAEIKNTARNVKQGVQNIKAAAGDLKGGLSFIKALTNGTGSKIGNGNAFLMCFGALLLDIVQGLVGIFDGGYLSSPISLGIQLAVYSLWFWLLGVSYWGKRNVVNKSVSGVLEMIPDWIGIPWVSCLIPSTAIMVFAAIALVRMEEFASKTEEQSQITPDKPEGVKTQTASGPEGRVKTPRREAPPQMSTAPEQSNVLQFRPRNTQDVVAPSVKQPGESNPPQEGKIAA